MREFPEEMTEKEKKALAKDQELHKGSKTVEVRKMAIRVKPGACAEEKSDDAAFRKELRKESLEPKGSEVAVISKDSFLRNQQNSTLHMLRYYYLLPAVRISQPLRRQCRYIACLKSVRI